MKTQRYVRILLVLFAFFFVLRAGVPGASDSIVLVHNSTTTALVVIATDASDQVKTAAQTLTDYVHESTGASLAIVTSTTISPQDTRVKIWLGTGAYPSIILKRIGALKDDGFVISFPSSTDIVIAAHSPWGIEFGVYELLERYLGVRWLFPGKSGEYVPHYADVSIPAEEVKQEPSFSSRLISGLKGADQTLWARRNRIHSTIVFHHNMSNIIPVAQFGGSNPEFYAMVDGKRVVPGRSIGLHWQPCFSSSGFAEAAIAQINRYFATHQGVKSFSLGVNDGGQVCQCDACRRGVDGKRNFWGKPDYSGIYYRWVDKVASGVRKSYPDVSFGCLAYEEVFSPPDTVVDPSVMPFITYESAKCVSAANMNAISAEISKWKEVASQLGWYDYIYGCPYLIPRIYFHTMAQTYQMLSNNNIRAIYAEAYPNFGEGPKLYLALKLMWNSNLNVDELLNDWFSCAVGAKSATYLRQYFQHWERFWTQTITSSPWFAQNRNYADFKDPQYLDLVSLDDMSTCRSLLADAVQQTENSQQKERAEMLEKSFEFYDASVAAYRGLVKKELDGRPVGYYLDLNAKRTRFLHDFESDPALLQALPFNIYPTLKF